MKTGKWCLVLAILYCCELYSANAHTTVFGPCSQGNCKKSMSGNGQPLEEIETELRGLTTPRGCFRSLTDDEGMITSPNWPRKTTKFLKCEFEIDVEGTRRIQLAFHEFNLVGHGTCRGRNNFVEITDLQDNRTELICGTNDGFVWTSDGNSLLIRFQAESENIFHLFRATYTVTEKHECSQTFFHRTFGMFFFQPNGGSNVTISSNDVTESSSERSLCTVLFHATPTHKISIAFETIDVLCDEPLLIHDSISQESTTVCGHYEAVSWTSTGNEAIVQYSQELTLDLALEFETLTLEKSNYSACSNYLKTSSGLFTSPSFPEVYPANLECWILIQADFSNIIQITFEMFSLDVTVGNDCEGDYFQMKDLAFDRVERVCGTLYPFTLTSDSNEVLLMLTTNTHLSYPGYQARYLTMPRSGMSDCFDTEDESLKSPGFPSSFSYSKDCSYLLQSKPGRHFVFEVMTFNLSDSTPCQHHYLQLTDVTSTRAEYFCGLLPPFIWTSSSNEVLVRLASTEQQEVTFRIDYTDLPLPVRPSHLSGCSAFLDSTSDQIRYPDEDLPPVYPRECLYVIHGLPGAHVTILVEEFVIGQPVKDRVTSRGTIEIIDPTSITTVLDIHSFTVSQPVFSWTSRQNELHIRVNELSSKQKVRFSATYNIRKLAGNEENIYYIADRQGKHTLTEYCQPTSRDCHLLFHGSPKDRVLLRFNFVNVQTNDCRLTSLKITDVALNDEREICSFSSNFSILSFGNEIILSFKASTNLSEISASFSHLMQTRPPLNDHQIFFRQSEGDFTSLMPSSLSTNSGKMTESRHSSIVMQVQYEERILLKFKDVVLKAESDEENSENRLDDGDCTTSVKLHDLTSDRAESVCHLAGEFSWTSDGNVVRVSYNNTSPLDVHAFRATFMAFPRYIGRCQVLTEESGILQSPNYPESYPALSRHQWLIHANPGDIISLVFNEFILEESENCLKDFLRVEDQMTSKQLTVCGSHQFAWISDANEVLITFETDEENQNKGFQINYEIIPEKYTSDCLYRFNEANGQFALKQSDTYNQKYGIEDGLCQFVVETDIQKRLRIKINDMILKTCDVAELMIVDLISYETTEICQIKDTFAWTSKSNAVFIYVLTYQHELPHFTLTWQSIERSTPPECSVTVGEETSMLRLSDIPSFQSLPNMCQTIVRLRPEKRVIVSLNDVTSMSTANCSNSLMIEDSVTGRADKLCDVDSTPYTWTSDGNEVIITISQSVNGGFPIGAKIFINATRRTSNSDCSKTLTEERGLLVSTDFPDTYPAHQLCSVLIHAPHGRLVRIKMQEFIVEGNGTTNNCQIGDFMKLTDVANSNYHTVCGHLHPFTWTSNGNEALIDFQSDDTLELKGFRGTYQTLTRTSHAEQDCSLILIEDPGRIQLAVNQDWLNSVTLGVSCLFLIQAHPSQRIIIYFEHVHLPANAECTDTFALIYDVTSSKSVTLCGDLPPFEWTSIANELEITFRTNAPSLKQRLTASYQFIPRSPPSFCDRVFSSMETTIITSEGFKDGYYPNDLDCSYVIQAGVNQIIEIAFDHFDLEFSNNCKCDYVIVQNNRLQKEEKFCGRKTPFSWFSENNFATIVFHSDHVITKKGFTAHFRFISNDMSSEHACNKNLTSTDGDLSSPGFPGHYGYNQDCEYVIQVKEGKVVFISFGRFDLESDKECKFDFLEIQSLPEGRTVRYCGSLDPFNWTSSTNKVRLTFHSDGSSTFPGFAATFSEVLPMMTTGKGEEDIPPCMGNLEGHTGFFSSPSFPEMYLDNEDCRIDFKASVGARVVINLIFMDVEFEPSCNFDYVLFLDVNSKKRSSRLCGELSQSFSWESESNFVRVLFHSDEIVQRSGFYGIFTEIPK